MRPTPRSCGPTAQTPTGTPSETACGAFRRRGGTGTRSWRYENGGKPPAVLELLDRLGAEHSHAVFVIEQSHDA
ncbi:MAG: hypothetical protein ACRDZO_10360 [Egibacteraceae bacterium]